MRRTGEMQRLLSVAAGRRADGLGRIAFIAAQGQLAT